MLSCDGVSSTPGIDCPRSGNAALPFTMDWYKLHQNKVKLQKNLQHIGDIIVWGNTAVEALEKGRKIIQILLKAGFAIKRSKDLIGDPGF